jgi:hypothetical protein
MLVSSNMLCVASNLEVCRQRDEIKVDHAGVVRVMVEYTRRYWNRRTGKKTVQSHQEFFDVISYDYDAQTFIGQSRAGGWTTCITCECVVRYITRR